MSWARLDSWKFIIIRIFIGDALNASHHSKCWLISLAWSSSCQLHGQFNARAMHTWNRMRPIKTGWVLNPKLSNSSFEFRTSVYPPNCSKVRICKTKEWGQWEYVCSPYMKNVAINPKMLLPSTSLIQNLTCIATKVYMVWLSFQCPSSCAITATTSSSFLHCQFNINEKGEISPTRYKH